jgi:hypothetical protein
MATWAHPVPSFIEMRYLPALLVFFTAPSGASGQNIPLAARLIMYNNGNMTVGATSSSGSPKGRIHLGAEDESVSAAISIRQSNSDSFGFDFGLDQTVNGNMFLHRVFSDVKYDVMEFDRNNGNVGIGTSPGNFKLAVNGKIWGTEVQVAVTKPPDYVFEKSYPLPTLEEVKSFIDQNKHLPEIPSAKEMEANGVNIGEMNMLLLKKIEELTLYVIEQQKEINDLKKLVKK